MRRWRDFLFAPAGNPVAARRSSDFLFPDRLRGDQRGGADDSKAEIARKPAGLDEQRLGFLTNKQPARDGIAEHRIQRAKLLREPSGKYMRRLEEAHLITQCVAKAGWEKHRHVGGRANCCQRDRAAPEPHGHGGIRIDCRAVHGD